MELARPGETTPAVIGTDAIYYVPDNRWGSERIRTDILNKYRYLTDKGWTILGYTTPGNNRRRSL